MKTLPQLLLGRHDVSDCGYLEPEDFFGTDFTVRALGSTLPKITDKLNYGQDVMTRGVAMNRHDMLFPEIPCQFENCKFCYRLVLFVIK